MSGKQGISGARTALLKYPFIFVYGKYMSYGSNALVVEVKRAMQEQAPFTAYVRKLDGNGWYEIQDMANDQMREHLIEAAYAKFPEISEKMDKELYDDDEL